jgi:hypothetical protein
VPGAEPEAPLVPDEPAKLRPDDPISIAAAAIIKVFFMSLVSLVWVASPNVGRIKRFVLIGILIEALKESVPSAREPIEG